MTVIIITVLLVLFFSGLIIPQKALFLSKAQYDTWKADYPLISGFIEFFRLNEIYVAPVTVFFLSLFFINLVVVISHRVPFVLRRAYLTGKDTLSVSIDSVKADPDVKEIKVPIEAGEHVDDKLKAFFRKRLWFVADIDAGRSFLAVRNRFSPLGFLLFHVSFLLCLVAGLFVTYTRFSGRLILTEGQVFDADMTQFRKIITDAKIFKALPPVGIMLEKVTPKYERNKPVELFVKLQVRYMNDIKGETVKVNEPVRRGAVSVLASDIGVSPLFVMKAENGGEIAGGYFSLNVLKGDEDSFEFEGIPYRFFVKFFPDYGVKDGKEYSISRELKNPHVHIRAEKDGKVISEGTIGTGKAMAVDSMSLHFGDVRYWVDFLFVREYGNIPLFIGFLLGATGLVMRLIFYQKTIKICVENRGQGSMVYLLGQSEFYKYSFQEEMHGLVSDLETVVGGTAQGRVLKQKGDLKA